MKRKITLFLGIMLLIPLVLNAQYFGKNKVQYQNFHWQFLQSEHFDIYFTDGGEKIAKFVAEIGEASYKRLKADFRYELIERIKIITYNSHNDFEQTNVDLSPPEESVGGFTEFFKNRVVIPYEGDWEKFRHVIHHELTHAVMLQMVYGAGAQSIITGMARLRLPLWWIEGLAEYESRGWDTESDMYMRDAALNSYAPPINRLYGFMAYKGGQSVLYYLSEKYGNEKIGELLGKIKVTKSIDRGFKQSIGIDIKDLTDKWHMYLKREYWPDIADRKEPEEIAKKLTDHIEDKNFVNSGPALSPKGDKIAYLSDKSDYFDIHLISAIDGKKISKLVSGQKSANLEELHWLRAGISWSPDGKFIVFASKAGDEDALHIVNVKKRKIARTIKLGLDGIFSPSWSPLGNEIAFMATKAGQGDIYSFNIETNSLHQITNDVFSDLEPCWSPDGKRLVFVSDRGDHLEPDDFPQNFDIYQRDFYNHDIYITDREGSKIKRITNTPSLEQTPVFSPDGDRLAYTSDRSGINNIYIYNIESGVEYPITNVLTGIFHLSWEGSNDKITFTSFYKGGYDIYLLKNPLKISPGDVQIQKTNFVAKQGEKAHRDITFYSFDSPIKSNNMKKKEAYSNFIFGDNFKTGKIEPKKEETSAFLDSSEFKLASGEYKIHNYKIKFSPDIVYGNASYSQFFGIQGATQIALSDILGNHRINLYTNLFYDLRNSNFQATYFYLPHQIDYGIGGFHYAYFFNTWEGWARDRNYGFLGYVSRPFSKYKRLDLGLTWLAIDREYLDKNYVDYLRVTYDHYKNLQYVEKKRNLIVNLTYVNDTVLWNYGFTGPVNGSRSSIGLTYSPGYIKNSLNFLTVKADWRSYFRIGKDYNFVFRIAGGISEGKKPQKFFLGGTNGWLNYRSRTGRLLVDNVDDIYFSTFEMPLRGALYYELIGNRFVLSNLEFRFPLIRYFILGWPLPLGLQNIRGVLFVDTGSAWDNNDLSISVSSRGGWPQLEDVFMGYGVGARLFLGYFVLRFDVAWTTDLVTSSHKPIYYFSLGPEF